MGEKGYWLGLLSQQWLFSHILEAICVHLSANSITASNINVEHFLIKGDVDPVTKTIANPSELRLVLIPHSPSITCNSHSFELSHC